MQEFIGPIPQTFSLSETVRTAIELDSGWFAKHHLIPTGWPAIDEALGGGLGRHGVTVLAGFPHVCLESFTLLLATQMASVLPKPEKEGSKPRIVVGCAGTHVLDLCERIRTIDCPLSHLLPEEIQARSDARFERFGCDPDDPELPKPNAWETWLQTLPIDLIEFSRDYSVAYSQMKSLASDPSVQAIFLLAGDQLVHSVGHEREDPREHFADLCEQLSVIAQSTRTAVILTADLTRPLDAFNSSERLTLPCFTHFPAARRLADSCWGMLAFHQDRFGLLCGSGDNYAPADELIVFKSAPGVPCRLAYLNDPVRCLRGYRSKDGIQAESALG